MALIARVSINDEVPVAILAATRLTGTTDPDSINTYEIGAWHVIQGENAYTPVWPEAHQPTVEHRYGDGGLELIKKIVAALP